MKILLADDDPDATYLLGNYLQRSGFDVCSVGSLEQAREALRDDRLRAVLCDRQLGDGDGLTLFERGRPEWIRWAAILSGEPTALEAISQASFDASIEKPFDVAMLVTSVKGKLA